MIDGKFSDPEERDNFLGEPKDNDDSAYDRKHDEECGKKFDASFLKQENPPKQECTPQKSNQNGMPREIWAWSHEFHNGWLASQPRHVPDDSTTKYLLFSAHEEEIDGLHSQIDYQVQRAEVAEAEVERLTAREAQWRELVELPQDLFGIPTSARTAIWKRIDQLRSELMEQGGEG